MNRANRLALIAVLLAGSAAMVRADAPISAAEYRSRLNKLSQQVHSLNDHPEQVEKLIASIPDEVAVNTESGEVDVNYRPLKNTLTEYSKGDSKLKASRLQGINAYLENLEADVTAITSASQQSAATRQALKEILARREFRSVRGPGLKETLLSKLFRWLGRLLSHLHFGGAGAFGVLQVLVYILVGGALLILLLWTVRQLRRDQEDLPAREIIPFSPSAKSWRSWLSEARDFAALHDWRNAIHLAYWAGISFLESGGAWKPNRARTPREYLRLLSSRNPNYAPLSSLTRKLETVWYGGRPAGQQDFQETLSHLEKLGCR